MKDKVFNIFGKIFGKVQGVGYREWARKKANHLNLKGWIKNCHDSTVEFEVNGKKKDVKAFIKECYNGPLLSRVEKIDFRQIDLSDNQESFVIKYK